MQPTSLKGLFEAQIRRRPQEVAARCGASTITFAQLDRRANQVARRLRRAGVGRDVPVGICLPRSLEMLVAVLGTIKAGGAYLPLDPEYPQERLAYMLADSRVGLVLCDGGQARAGHGLPHSAGVELIDVTSPDADVRSEDEAGLESPPAPDALAYVIYTSGSTGQPKGVLGTEGGMLNRLAWMWETFPFQPGEVGCVKTSLNFLDSFWEIFGPLLQGVPVVVMPDEVVKDGEALVRALATGGVTRLVVVPSLLRALLTTVPDVGARLERLTLWVTSGEALVAELARRFREALPGARLLNLYGASEVSADCAWYDVGESAPERVAIGRPIAHNAIHLLDDALQPVPPGAVGQLYVAGVGLARGYLGRPDLTAERFVPDPSGIPGGRMYRSGDLARLRPDGALEYLGRSDQQVKVRGFRVELGEIEAALRRHPAVAQVVVTARAEHPGQTRLVGYVVPAAGADADGPALRGHLAQTLPDYMLPAAIVFLPALPLTPSGKVDRNALPAPEFASGPTTPRTAAESRLAALFAGVLELDRVGPDDRFFDLGGDSISAMDLARRARDAGFAITAGDVLQHQTVEALATKATAAS